MWAQIGGWLNDVTVCDAGYGSLLAISPQLSASVRAINIENLSSMDELSRIERAGGRMEEARNFASVQVASVTNIPKAPFAFALGRLGHKDSQRAPGLLVQPLRDAYHCSLALPSSTLASFLLYRHSHKELTTEPEYGPGPRADRPHPSYQHENSRVSGQGHPGEVWSGCAAWAYGRERRGSRRSDAGAVPRWRNRSCGEGADPCRWARQRRRREDCEVRARCRRDRGQHARHDAGDAPDWPRGQECAAATDRRDAADCSGAVSRHRARPRQWAERFHGVGGGRHGDRRGCGQ